MILPPLICYLLLLLCKMTDRLKIKYQRKDYDAVLLVPVSPILAAAGLPSSASRFLALIIGGKRHGWAADSSFLLKQILPGSPLFMIYMPPRYIPWQLYLLLIVSPLYHRKSGLHHRSAHSGGPSFDDGIGCRFISFHWWNRGCFSSVGCKSSYTALLKPLLNLGHWSTRCVGPLYFPKHPIAMAGFGALHALKISSWHCQTVSYKTSLWGL